MSAPQVYATEGGLGAYADGIDSFMMGALPPPGVYFLNYALYLNVSDYKDIRIPSNGDPKYAAALGAIPGAGPGVKFKDIPLNARGATDDPSVRGWSMVDVLRTVVVTKTKVLGGDLGFHVILPVQHLSYTRFDWAGADLLSGDHTAQKTGLKNLIVAPVVGWHLSKNLHVLAACDVVLPTGAYDRWDTANLGTGYMTFMPLVAGTYLSDSGFEVGVKLMYDINMTNKETGYYSGNAFHADYIVAQRIAKNFNVGISGYYFQQLNNDTMRDSDWSRAASLANPAIAFDGNKSKAFAVGPAINYNYKNMYFRVKVQFDTMVENRPETQRYWFDWMYAF
jgi:hypothetical protein